MTEPLQTLRRELGVGHATLLGLGSILGTGIFVSIALAAEAAGVWTLPAILLAGLLALCNALSSAQLAAAHPVSGGTYEYGYRLISPSAGFAAGWLFLCAKSASAATAALGFASYLIAITVPSTASPELNIGIAIGVTIALTILVARGIRRSAQVNAIIVGLTIFALLIYVFSFLPDALTGSPPENIDDPSSKFPGLQTFLFTTGFLFVAYTGYGRIATLGEEVREPRKTIPKAILTTLAVSAALYGGVTFVGLRIGLPVGDLHSASLTLSAEGAGSPVVAKIVAVGAMTSMLGVLLNLILGLSRVILAMGRRTDLPPVFGSVSSTDRSPVAATFAVGIIIAAISLVGDVKTTWSFSAVTVLLYYATTNIAALRLAADDRLYHPIFPAIGLIGCLTLAFAVPPSIWVIAIAVLAVGFILRTICNRLHTPDDK
ncbi:APC family permease [Stratiformator vulcanicus]|uniref:Putative amino acid permease YhdG n=1 Tax=Stratiformator vulcanicus TaxID=2527980 RepID=A0A517R6V1_9PLAN|nr:APC family permease [Stratiformator vulcanicus]QDT39610.1 putative amino acid permease YhdG [Stratiformator vulcanicus]